MLFGLLKRRARLPAPPPSLRFTWEGGEVVLYDPEGVLTLSPRKFTVENWHVGDLWYDTNAYGWRMSLGMETTHWRQGRGLAPGFNGDECHVATYCWLLPGDRLYHCGPWWEYGEKKAPRHLPLTVVLTQVVMPEDDESEAIAVSGAVLAPVA